MPFDFLKYLQPTHYFQKSIKSNKTIFPIVGLLPDSIVNQLDVDKDYLSIEATHYDLSWQAIQRGYIGDVCTYDSFSPISVQDNYRFIRKNFHSVWVVYVLILRLLTFHNPIVEIRSWFRTRQVKYSIKYQESISYSDWTHFKSELITRNPKISVVIPTLNRYSYLKAILKDFEQQDYKNFEIIIVDQSEPFKADFYSEFQLDINLIHQKEKALWLARNTAIQYAKGAIIALSEDDVRIQPDWISSHIKCLDFFKAKVSAGVFYPEGKHLPKERSFFAIASQFATGNAMLYKSVFKEVGLFDRQFEKQRMGDGEFGIRIYLNDIKSVSNPYASCIDVKAPIGGLRELGSWDAFRPSKWFSPRPIPSVTYYFRRYFGNRATRLALLRIVPISLFSYKLKKNRLALLLSLLLAVLLSPFIVYQVWKSWTLANEKLKQGPLIDYLNE